MSGQSLTVQANSDIVVSGGDLTTNGGTIVLNSDRDADQSGLISIGNSTVTTNGGDIVMGGGTNPLTTPSYGITANFVGLTLTNSTFTTNAGDFTAKGHALNSVGGWGKKGASLNSVRIVTTSGNIDISGTGGPGNGAGGTGEHGIVMGNGGGVTPGLITGSGNITLTGISQGTGDKSYGIAITGFNVESNSGDINITGTSNAAATGLDNEGIFIGSALGISTVDGDISLTGTGTATEAAINIDGDGVSKIETSTGNITLTSLLGDIELDKAIEKIGAGSSNLILRSKDNILLEAQADITATNGPLNVTLNADRDADEEGAISLTGVDITTLGGDIMLGGGLNPETDYAVGIGALIYGVLIQNGSDLNAGGGDITINGKGKLTDGTSRIGVNISLSTQASSLTTSGDGNITIKGQGGGNGSQSNNYGLYTIGADITAEDGDITITATGGNGIVNNYGYQTNGTQITHTGSGNLTITATAGTNTTLDINDANGNNSNWGSATTNNVTINANSTDFTRFGTIRAANNITIAPRTAGTSIGLGGATGDLQLDDTILAKFNAGNTLIIGNSALNNNDVIINTWDLTDTTYDVSVLGNDFDIDGLTIGAGDITLNAAHDIVINAAIDNSGAGGDVALIAGNSFTNSAGANGIDAGLGRYLVYADGPSNVAKGALSAGNLYNRRYDTDLPNTIESSFGDRFVYGFQPTLIFNANDITLNTFNPNFNSFTYTFSGLETGDTLSSVFSGAPAFSKSQQAPGVFGINGGLGSLSSLIGYDFAFVPGTLTMLSPSQQLSSTVEFQMQMPDLWSGANKSYTITYVDNGFVSSGQSSTNTTSSATEQAPQERPVQIRRNGQRMNNSTSPENDAGVRLVEADLMEIEQPIIEFYDLCSYNIKYCQ